MKIKILAAVIALAAVGGYFAWSRMRGQDEDVLRLSGNIEFRKVDVAFKTAGRLVELWTDEGASVTKGMKLARLDAEQIQRFKERDAAGVAMAESQLEQIQTAILYQREAMASEAAVRESEIRQARAKLRELEEGARPQEIEQARSAVSELTALRTQAEADFERATKLVAREDISQAQFEQFRTKLAAVRAQLRSAEERLALLQEGPRKTDIEAGQANLARAQAALRWTKAQSLDIQRKGQELTARRAEITRAKAGVGAVETQLSDAVAESTIDGVVMVKSANVGEVLPAGSPVLTLGDIDHPWLRGYVPENQLGRVRLGMPVSVRTDSYPGKIYPGKITFIASEAEFTPKQIQTQEERVKLVYRIKIDLANPGRELKLNMPVDAEIELAK